jgi:acetate kinase
MNILILNSGSSSIKFSIFNSANDEQIFKSEIKRCSEIENDLALIPPALEKAGKFKIDAIGHRVVHGGSDFHKSSIIDETVKNAIKSASDLAPLHNDLVLSSIATFEKIFPEVPQIAVFDTEFHQTMPPRATTYAIPKQWRDAGLRRYGFHGTSHKYVMQRVAQELETPVTDLRIISCHLGNGASVCAINRGASVDTSMGMTALEGLVMGTRVGDIDPGIFNYLHKNLGLSVSEIEEALYHKSGLLALSELSNDMYEIEKMAGQGDKNAQLAINVYAYRVRKYIGAYAASMSGFDVLAFTGGIGENSASMRKRVCSGLEFLGLYFDDDKNVQTKLSAFEAPQLQLPNSRIKVLVTQTREQWMIAKEVKRILKDKQFVHSNELPKIPVAVSAHHIHLTQESVEQLFGAGYQLKKLRPLHQAKEWASEEKIDIVGPRGELKGVRILGPCRKDNQIEISETESFILGIEVPVRLSGDVAGTPEVKLVGPAGSIQSNGIIVPQRHIHMNPQEAEKFGLKQNDVVEVEVLSKASGIIFRDVVIRIKPDYSLEMHIDTDEANAANISHGGEGELITTDKMIRINSKAVNML